MPRVQAHPAHRADQAEEEDVICDLCGGETDHIVGHSILCGAGHARRFKAERDSARALLRRVLAEGRSAMPADDIVLSDDDPDAAIEAIRRLQRERAAKAGGA